MLWLASSYLEDKAASQGVKKYHLCLSTPSNSLWEAIELKAWSPDKFMKVTSVKVSDEDGFLIKAKNTIVNERIIDRIDATSSANHPDSSTDSGQSTSTVP